MLIIGFDPGSISCGIGIIKKDNKHFKYVYSEEVKLTQKDILARMRQLWFRLNEIISTYPIKQAAIEEGFLGPNVKSLKTLSKIQGIILASLFEKGVEIKTYSPKEVKQFVTGNGNALKFQVKKMIKILLNITTKDLGDDESDGLAVAYCHGMKIK